MAVERLKVTSAFILKKGNLFLFSLVQFYEAAFKGNEAMIREKMNECSRHRGKFNPEREDTPAGFWDLNMPPTQDTEAFNMMNNRD